MQDYLLLSFIVRLILDSKLHELYKVQIVFTVVLLKSVGCFLELICHHNSCPNIVKYHDCICK